MTRAQNIRDWACLTVFVLLCLPGACALGWLLGALIARVA